MAQVHVVSGSEPELRVWRAQRQVLRASYYPVIGGASFAEKTWGNGDPCSLPVGTPNGSAALEDGLGFFRQRYLQIQPSHSQVFTQLMEKLTSEQTRARARERQLYSKPEAAGVFQQVSGFTHGSASRYRGTGQGQEATT